MVPNFRSKSLANDEFVYGGFCIVHDGLGAGVPCIWEVGADRGIPIDAETLGQSTGLKDKNGVEIFEGDIVIDTAGPQIKMIVKWIDDCSGFRTVGKYNGDSYIGYVGHINKLGNNTCEILGNIYENKNLLEN